MVVGPEDQQENSDEVKTVLKSLDDPETAGLILEEQANALKKILGDPSVLKLIRAHDKLEEGRKQVENQDTKQLAKEVLEELEPKVATDNNAAELSGLLQEPHFLALMESHDAVAFKTYDSPPPYSGIENSNGYGGGEPIRMVGLHKQTNEHLGVTLKVDDGQLVISRIIHGGMIDRQGLLHVGDIIKEVNGKDTGGNAEELQNYLSKSMGKITLKVLPSYHESPALCQVYVRAHFSYDPTKDDLIPCADAGLAFEKGEVLQIVDQEDPNWWQAKRVGSSKEAGIIPSQIYEERRRAGVKKPKSGGGFLCGSKKKQKMMYTSAKNSEFDKHELTLYEEVARMPPFNRKTLILIGAQGVGRRTLKNKLIMSDRARFGTTVPHTSRQPREGEQNGQGYFFVAREEMERDIRAGKYIEYGEYDGNLYGTKIDTIREIMRSGKMCFLDVNPTALKVLKTPEFMPYIVFLAAPKFETLKEINQQALSKGTTNKKRSDEELRNVVAESERLYNLYSHYFDLTLVNTDMDATFQKLEDAIDALSTEPQWVPVSWVY
ncbi:MAGUK p55 subfamily member 6-like isoform X2 [Actinia tenebrosa]|uniref:MAGUK p55 subfamily member 6-like isoform X2 n=1 Tax=Actinia tenebrosa TaxID=6105 RepID=A0A6P8HT56_ACTTE|nr:MAGUK p55 subfamily member 6-like isoform X2 [Actinia tenebrosa]